MRISSEFPQLSAKMKQCIEEDFRRLSSARTASISSFQNWNILPLYDTEKCLSKIE